MTNSSSHQQDDEQQLEALRQLVLGENGDVIYQSLKPKAQQLVMEVISEALRERQNNDESVVPVIRPIVEASVETSVAQQSEKFTTILYPLVGSMVRKSVAAFLSQFIEKTNTLLENSLSVKGLKMRYQAWKAGIPFSQYLILKAYRYKVDTVLLIHRESGTLLYNVSSDSAVGDNADLVSAMLSAINDFVSDSFTEHQHTQQLDEIKTDDVSLYLSHGPQALLVVASRGAIPSKDRGVFTEIIEQIHKLHAADLLAYEGDNDTFISTEPLLQKCLITQRHNDTKKPKTPWLGYSVVCALLFLLAWFCWLKIEVYVLSNKLHALNHEPGFVINSIKINKINNIELLLLRDPNVISFSQWAEKNNIETHSISLVEHPYISLERSILIEKLKNVISNYGLKLKLDEQTVIISGELNWQRKQQFDTDLARITGIDRLVLDTSALVIEQTKLGDVKNKQLQQEVFTQIAARLSLIQLNFNINEVNLTEQNQQQLAAAASYAKQLVNLARELETDAYILIIGTSDQQGSTAKNLSLSKQRAEQVKRFMVNSEVNIDKLFTTGIGEVTLASGNIVTRKVIFNVIHSPFSDN